MEEENKELEENFLSRWSKKKSKQKTHVVKDGDSMYSISQAYGIKLKFLYKYNRMDIGTEPFIGQKLNLNKKIKFN